MASTTYPPAAGAAKRVVSMPGAPARVELRAATMPQAAATQTGIWVCVCAIFMCFAALVSALVVREGTSSDWRHLTLPRILYFNTLVLMLSSYTLEVSRHRFSATVRQEAGPEETPRPGLFPWLYATILLGSIFVAGQYLAWKALAAGGFYLATNPSSSFFYVLTAMHGVHVLGGMAGLIYMARRLARSVSPRQASAFGATAVYWHFMGFLWIFLFLVMAIRL
jgi:cytochrome c oxidase subunit III